MYGLIGKMNALPGKQSKPPGVTHIARGPGDHHQGSTLIAGFSTRVETTPIGGQGLKVAEARSR